LTPLVADRHEWWRGLYDPCRLVRQVKQFARLERTPGFPFFDPCRLVRQVKQFGG
jgi:hypothetical protein